MEHNQTYRRPDPAPRGHPAKRVFVENDLGPYVELMDLIGEGEFGSVYIAYCHKSGFPGVVAVKTLKGMFFIYSLIPAHHSSPFQLATAI